MKLLFDQNLSFRLCGLLSDLFPDCEHVRRLGFERADDLTLWRYARDKGYAFVTLDADFAELAALFGAPPKVIWLRRGNQSTAATSCADTAKLSNASRLSPRPVSNFIRVAYLIPSTTMLGSPSGETTSSITSFLPSFLSLATRLSNSAGVFTAS